jgi:predicted RNase H-related nuclease YkuK (DUF458 family)
MGRIDETWLTAAGEIANPDQLMAVIGEHVTRGGRVFVGCDSNINGPTCTYVTAIALYDETARIGGRYFFQRTKVPFDSKTPLRVRLMDEATQAIEVALELQGALPAAQIEIHLDVSQIKTNKSNTVADQVAGYARAAGFSCKLKPDSWASSCVADEHTR